MLMYRCVWPSLLVTLVLATANAWAAGAEGQEARWVAEEHKRQTIYHSPQKPGYTCWTGAWVMPDGSIMVAFTQATGLVKDRPPTPKKILDHLSYPPAYDMNGLDLRNVYLHSKDAGKTWEQVSADRFRSCVNYITGNGQTVLTDGTLVRAVWGQYLPFDESVPKTGYLQRSRDGSRKWGPPEVLLDAKRYTTWPTRVRSLRDGRLLVLGGLSHVPAGSLNRLAYYAPGVTQPLLIVSNDQGKSWSQPVQVIPEEYGKGWSGEEYDLAELPNGDLLTVFRTKDPTRKNPDEVRWQGLLKKEGKTWKPQAVGPAPFPHSGHPELLAAREGLILHLATSGIHWTDDAGRSWHKLDTPGTYYYPRSVQAADGRIYVFAHAGGDDPYGTSDQSIVMDTFRLRRP